MAIYTFRVDGMRSDSCGMLIDETLADVNGVASSATSLHTRQATVEMDATRCSTDEVVAAIIAAGYIAQLEQPCPPRRPHRPLWHMADAAAAAADVRPLVHLHARAPVEGAIRWRTFQGF